MSSQHPDDESFHYSDEEEDSPRKLQGSVNEQKLGNVRMQESEMAMRSVDSIYNIKPEELHRAASLAEISFQKKKKKSRPDSLS